MPRPRLRPPGDPTQGVISDSGEVLTAACSEKLAGLTLDPMVVYSNVELFRLPAAILPCASFSALPVAGSPPWIANFTDLPGNDPANLACDFGDGDSSAEQHAVHIYSQPGSYTVTLTVANDAGFEDMLVEPNYISVTAPAAPAA